MATNVTTSIRRKEIDLLEEKANASGITKCAYVRNLIRNDLGNTQKVIKKDETPKPQVITIENSKRLDI